eukprot:CAMPEP_0172492058 /NCGR_PEP_ID=MMETSP1066-20121228/23041_1 /TAXON_ID=671091 /ORGANISM="Coscinodiscus wailesii, Strain CCMP2513" /LENGTH=125 /DNA_ID=CAMNT_0013261441 /DNA_START=38 /DNA_END=411 /DNA_ORIENTATION=+
MTISEFPLAPNCREVWHPKNDVVMQRRIFTFIGSSPSPATNDSYGLPYMASVSAATACDFDTLSRSTRLAPQYSANECNKTMGAMDTTMGATRQYCRVGSRRRRSIHGRLKRKRISPYLLEDAVV